MKLYKNTAYIYIVGSGEEQTPHIAQGAMYDSKDGTIVFWFNGRTGIFNVDKIVKDEECIFEIVDSNLLRVSFHPVTLEDLKKYGQDLFGEHPEFKTNEGVQNWIMKKS